MDDVSQYDPPCWTGEQRGRTARLWHAGQGEAPQIDTRIEAAVEEPA